MITLYGMTSPNVVKVIIALEEMELPYRFQPVDVFAGETFRPDFLALSPTGKVPVIVDDDGPEEGGAGAVTTSSPPDTSAASASGYTVIESGAILLYLAEKTGRLLPRAGRARYDALQWLVVQLTGVGPMFGQYVHFMRYGPKGEGDYALNRYRTQVTRLCELLEARLAASPYLAGPDYTIADVATVPWGRALPMLLGAGATAPYPKLQAWIETVSARPAVARAVAKTEALRATLTPGDKAEADTLDRLFGRGRYAA